MRKVVLECHIKENRGEPAGGRECRVASTRAVGEIGSQGVSASNDRGNVDQRGLTGGEGD